MITDYTPPGPRTKMTRGTVKVAGRVYAAVRNTHTLEVYRFALGGVEGLDEVDALRCSRPVQVSFTAGNWPEPFDQFRMASAALAAYGFVFRRNHDQERSS